MKFNSEFIKKLKDRNKQAHTTFYLNTVDSFFRYLKSSYFLKESECEDIISLFYIKFWDSILKYDEQYSFESFFWIVFRNIVKDYFKKHKEKYFTEFDGDYYSFEEQIEDDDISLKDFLNQDFQQEYIQKAIEELDGESKTIIYWKFIEDKTYKEISDLLQITVSSLRKKMSRILVKLRQKLKHYK